MTRDERQLAEVRERRAGQQRRLARHRQAGVLEEHAAEHDGVAVAREQIDEPLRHEAATASVDRATALIARSAQRPARPLGGDHAVGHARAGR